MRDLIVLIAIIFTIFACFLLTKNGIEISDLSFKQLLVFPIIFIVLVYALKIPNLVATLILFFVSTSFYYHYLLSWRCADLVVPAFAINNGESKAAIFTEALRTETEKINPEQAVRIKNYPFRKIPENIRYSVISGTPRFLTIRLPKSEQFIFKNDFKLTSDTSQVGLMLDKDGATVRFLALMFLARKEKVEIQKRDLLVKAVRNHGRWSSQSHRAWPLFLLGNSYIKEKDGLEKALDYYKRAHKLFLKKDHSRLKSDLLHNYGVAQYYKGVLEKNRRIKQSGANKVRRAVGLLPRNERKYSIFRSNLGKIRNENGRD